MNLQRFLLAALGFVTLVAVNGCVVHEEHDHWWHHHDHTVVVEPVHHD
jgi:hypothetical protein